VYWYVLLIVKKCNTYVQDNLIAALRCRDNSIRSQSLEPIVREIQFEKN